MKVVRRCTYLGGSYMGVRQALIHPKPQTQAHKQMICIHLYGPNDRKWPQATIQARPLCVVVGLSCLNFDVHVTHAPWRVTPWAWPKMTKPRSPWVPTPSQAIHWVRNNHIYKLVSRSFG